MAESGFLTLAKRRPKYKWADRGSHFMRLKWEAKLRKVGLSPDLFSSLSHIYEASKGDPLPNGISFRTGEGVGAPPNQLSALERESGTTNPE